MTKAVSFDLPSGQKFIVDEEDADFVRSKKWRAAPSKNCVYVQCNVKQPDGTVRSLFLHRMIIGAPKGRVVDHINGDGLDNRKENLRICTQSQNLRNKRNHRLEQGHLKGCTWRKDAYLWEAQIWIDGRKVNLGYYRSQEEAHAAYVKAAAKNFGEFFRAA